MAAFNAAERKHEFGLNGPKRARIGSKTCFANWQSASNWAGVGLLSMPRRTAVWLAVNSCRVKCGDTCMAHYRRHPPYGDKSIADDYFFVFAGQSQHQPRTLIQKVQIQRRIAQTRDAVLQRHFVEHFVPQQYQQPAADAMEAAFSLPADDPLAGEPGEPFDLTLWRGGVGETSSTETPSADTTARSARRHASARGSD